MTEGANLEPVPPEVARVAEDTFHWVMYLKGLLKRDLGVDLAGRPLRRDDETRAA